MHESVLAFGTSAITAEMVAGKRVLEVGSLNVNGSLRAHVEALNPAQYFGIDLQDGPGVDQVITCEEILPLNVEQWDLIVCTEMLEHAENWRAAVNAMKEMLATGGWLLLTTRSVGFPFHEYPGDHWRFGPGDMAVMFADFCLHTLDNDTQAPGVFVLVQKPADWVAADLHGITVHSMKAVAA
jgi:SAM-dependent methyltransferase